MHSAANRNHCQKNNVQMKRLFLPAAKHSVQMALFITLTTIFTSVHAQELKVMSFNIRLNVTSDSINAWPNRVDLVTSQVSYHQVHLLGVQEATPGQMDDLRAKLTGYRSIGGGRDNGTDKGEASALFYDTSRLLSLANGMFWLSKTPDVPGSLGWDAQITRMVTWSKFRDRKTRKIFFAFNTHFDHIGKEARRESAKMVLAAVKRIAGSTPSVITGDFNAVPTDEPIRVIMDKNDPLHLVDSKDVSLTPHYGPTGTFNGFQSKERDDFPIDYIFIKGAWKVKSHATLSQTWHGRFASDHFAVLASLQL
ncbi:MAG: endonuclease/exonuclease/phosphatase family protein [Chitinophagaceae bacterium]|nr:MAG: endonuclease/exonuclease/phosphatase family protein [Chitinophagaceae bacterium]